MRTSLIYLSNLILCFLLFNQSAFGRVWRVNNNPGISADFADVQTANNNASVVAGDVLYIEGSATSYGSATVTKALTLIGPGYFLSGANSNAGLQYNGNTVSFGNLDIAANGITVMGINSYVRIYSSVDNVTFTRSGIYVESINTGGSGANWVFNKCFLGFNYSLPVENIQVTNCIIANNFYIPNSTNGLIRNNTFITGVTTSNSYISNNIFATNSTLSFTNCTIKNNLSVGNNLPAADNNQVNIPYASLFVGSGSTDGQYILAAGSPALGAGETINGVTPDAGAFGTADPYRLSGIPPIPTIYSLTVPPSIPSSATSMTVSFSSRSNN